MKKSFWARTGALALMICTALSGCSGTPSPVTGAVPALETASVGETLTAEPLPEYDEYLIDGVPMYCQYPEYPTGCETVSTIMLLRFFGYSVSESTFINRYLPKNNDFYLEDETLYGPDPTRYFVGSPYDVGAWGCMSPVIEKALNNYFADCDRYAQAVDLSGKSLDELCRSYVAANIPVLVWATVNMQETYVSITWILPNGGVCEWLKGEHCLLLVGFTENCYLFSDPYTGSLASFPKAKTEIAYEALGRQALTIR